MAPSVLGGRPRGHQTPVSWVCWLIPWQNGLSVGSMLSRALAEINLCQLKKAARNAVPTISPCEISNAPTIVGSINYYVYGCGRSCAMNAFYIF